MAKILDNVISALGMELVDKEEEEEAEKLDQEERLDGQEKEELQNSIYGDVKVVKKQGSKGKKRMTEDFSNLREEPDEDNAPEEFFQGRKKIPTMRLYIVEPENFDQVREAADMLKDKKSVIINLEEVEYEDARKIIDFMSGNVYALGGTVHKISASIILFAPDTMAVENLKSPQTTAPSFPPEIERIREDSQGILDKRKESPYDQK